MRNVKKIEIRKDGTIVKYYASYDVWWREYVCTKLLNGRFAPKLTDAGGTNGTYYVIEEYIIGKHINPQNMELREMLRTIDAIFWTAKYLWRNLPKYAIKRLPKYFPIDPLQIGVISRDIAPENIIMQEDGTPYIVDWNMAAVSDVFIDIALVIAMYPRATQDLDNITRYIEQKTRIPSEKICEQLERIYSQFIFIEKNLAKTDLLL